MVYAMDFVWALFVWTLYMDFVCDLYLYFEWSLFPCSNENKHARNTTISKTVHITAKFQKTEVDVYDATTPWTQDVNWTYIRRSEDALGIFWTSFE